MLLCSLFIAVGGDAQSPDTKEKPVWTLEFIKVRPEQYALALGQLDDQWVRIRHLPSNTPPGMLKWQREDLSKANEHLFLDVPAEGSPQLKYLAKQQEIGRSH
jgi:hypothetical protein